MKLNRVEKMLMNNPVRALLQRWYEAGLFERIGGRATGERVLEIGCGRGVGAKIIVEQFGAREVCAYDLDPDMVELARTRLATYVPNRVSFAVGDAAHIPEPDESFDAVFDFGTIHHVPDWRRAVREVSRVLRPGGRFYFEEITRRALQRWVYRALLDHPTDDRFSTSEFIAELERHKLLVGKNYVERCFGDLLMGVGRKALKSVD